MQSLAQDLKYAARILWRSPAFTAVAVLALALGIGATTAIYTVVDAVMLRPLPFPQPQQLVVIESYLRHRHASTSYPDFLDYRDRGRTLASVAAWTGRPATITGVANPENVDAIVATPELFSVLGSPMALGRGFTAEEARPGSDVVVLSHALWKRRYDGDRAIVGKRVSIDGRPLTVVGVLPERYPWPLGRGDDPAALVMPYPLDRNDMDSLRNRGSHFLKVVARLKPGVSVEQARADVTALVDQMKKDHPSEDDDGTLDASLERLDEFVVGPSRPALMMWLAAVLCVLAIACANVAGLLLARATVRQREIAIRVALGAGRGRIVRQMLTESVLLGVLGGGVGVLLSLWLVDLLVALIPSGLPHAHEISVDGRALAVTFGLAVLTGVIFGLWPALQASRPDLNDALKETARTTANKNRRARNALVVGEIAAALLLLVGAGLTLRSFAKLSHIDPGFQADGLVIAQMGLPQARYPDEKADDQYRHKAVAAVQAVAGVQGATAGAPLPFSHADMAVGVSPPGGQTNPAIPSARYVSVAPNWFEVLGIPIERGRTFSAVEDRMDGPPALVVSHEFAARMWPGQDPIGKHVNVGICIDPCPKGAQIYEVIGVVGDMHHDRLDEAAPPTIYTAFGHLPLGFVGVVARTPAPRALPQEMRKALLSVDADLPPNVIYPITDGIKETMTRERVLMILLGLFAALALALATIGVYGVMSYTVTQRTREIGIRVALGAGTGEILGLVLGETLRLSLAAVALGVGAALLAGRALQSQLYGVAATDPVTLVAVTLVILLVCLVASFLPARRASKVDPMVALRYE